jgi:hypothetical protein
MVRSCTSWGAALFAVLFGCSSKSEAPPGPCGTGFDGCLSISIGNWDTRPFDDAESEDRDGKGTAYIALLDECPSPTNMQFRFASPPVVVEEVDLSSDIAVAHASIPYKFHDSRYDTEYEAGDDVVLSGFMDDNDNADIEALLPEPGDSILDCIPVQLEPGKSSLSSAMVPCLIFPDTVFDQGLYAPTACELYAPFIEQLLGGHGGATGSGGGAASPGGAPSGGASN